MFAGRALRPAAAVVNCAGVQPGVCAMARFNYEDAALEAARIHRIAEANVRQRIAARQLGTAFAGLGNAADRAALAFVKFTTVSELKK